MPSTSLQVRSRMPPAEVLRVLTDFSPARAEAWPTIDLAHLALHGQGDGWADVTEGTAMTWERVRYSWSPDGRTVTAVTTDSNAWAPGSRWDYTLTPDGDGTLVDVRLTRRGRNLKGRIIGLLLPLVGPLVIRRSFESALKAR